jgi:hypothetical protein
MERVAMCIKAKAAQQDYLARMRASSSWSKQFVNLNQTLEER